MSTPTEDRTVEWRPGRGTAVLLNLAAVPLAALGVVVFFGLATLRLSSSLSIPINVWVALAVIVALVVLLLVVHEGLHGLIMVALGARPRFGALVIGGFLPALYTTAPGHLFSRAQYLAVGLTPMVTISLLGGLACLTPLGLVLALPLSIHLSGCVGDLAATLRILREPRGTLYEDLRDGMRFHRPS